MSDERERARRTVFAAGGTGLRRRRNPAAAAAGADRSAIRDHDGDLPDHRRDHSAPRQAAYGRQCRHDGHRVHRAGRRDCLASVAARTGRIGVPGGAGVFRNLSRPSAIAAEIGGMQIMLSRPTGTRGVYVIGGLHLARAERECLSRLFPPPVAHGAQRRQQSAPLGLTAAIVLTLVFRFGARQRTEAKWSEADGSIAAAIASPRDKAQEWKVAHEVVETAAVQAQSVLTYILGEYAHRPAGMLRVSDNGIELRVDVAYQGTHSPPLPESVVLPRARRELDDEEAAAFAGLRDFLHSLAADRKLAREHNGRITVRLSYAA